MEVRKLKIFCPTHQSVFEVEENPQIICEIKEHALSGGFPRSEFWEYCADCQTFSPSKFGTGGKAKNACPHCERTTARRFLCDECKIVAYDSDEETKGKIHEIDAAQGIKPDCPGCRKIYVGAKILGHLCRDIDGMILTPLAECPFCLKPTLEQAKPKKVEPIPTAKLDNQAVSSQCPNCGHWGKTDRAVCGKCGAQINALGTGIAAGTATPKTQLLGSICPNCGAGNDSDSVFCVNCGQALKAVPQAADETETVTVVNPKFPPNMPPIPVTPPNFSPATEQSVAPQKMSSESKVALFLILGVFGFLIVAGLIAVNSNKSTQGVNNTSNSSNNGTANNRARVNSPSNYRSNNSTMDNRASTNSSSPVIGRKGRLNKNSNIRLTPGTDGTEIRGTHYENAELEVLDISSFYNKKDEYVTWYRVRILSDGCDRVENNGCGNNWERNGYKGYGEAETVGWIYSDSIDLY